ncbi:MAG: hypothetical protein ACRDRK_22600 [Pseudonocardia sp.]
MTSPESARLPGRVDAHDETIRAIGDTLLDVKDIVEEHTHALADVKDVVDGHTRTLADHGRQLIALRQDVTEIRGDVTEIRGGLAQQGQTLDRHGEMLGQHGEMLTEILRRLLDTG